MTGELSLWVRAAHRAVSAVDNTVEVLLGAMQIIGQRKVAAPRPTALAGFRRANKLGAKGAKWSLLGVIALGAMLMLGAAILLPRQSAAQNPAVRSAQAVIAARCRAGVYRDFPEIEQADCAAHLTSSHPRDGDAK